MSHPRILDRKRTALVIVDIQEAFRNVVPKFEHLVSRAKIALEGFQILDLPIIITEQYPKGLGRTADDLLDVLPEDFDVVEKTAFSSCGATPFMKQLRATDVSQVVLCGLETHICVNQTAHDLLTEAFEVHILNDAVGSRHEQDKATALSKMQMNGVVPSCVEMALFELLRDSKDEQFKQIQALIK
ncbi:MAG: isochorismatase family protein [Aridibacter sp.]